MGKYLIVLFCASAAQAAFLPYFAPHVVPSVAKSTITYKTAAFEPVDAATPADTKKIELVETEHSQDVYTPTYTYAAGLPLVHHAAPVVQHAPVATYTHGLVGYPFGVLPVVPAAAAAEEAAAADEAEAVVEEA